MKSFYDIEKRIIEAKLNNMDLENIIEFIKSKKIKDVQKSKDLLVKQFSKLNDKDLELIQELI